MVRRSLSLQFIGVPDADVSAYAWTWIAWDGEVLDSSENDPDQLQEMLNRFGDREYVLTRVRAS